MSLWLQTDEFIMTGKDGSGRSKELKTLMTITSIDFYSKRTLTVKYFLDKEHTS